MVPHPGSKPRGSKNSTPRNPKETRITNTAPTLGVKGILIFAKLMRTLMSTMYSELLLEDPEVSLFHSLMKRMNLDGGITLQGFPTTLTGLGDRNIG
jgi:hypothetical protein